MAEVSLKRHRDATEVHIDGEHPETQPQNVDSESEPKKQKLMNQISSILELDDDKLDHNLTFLMSSFENEIIYTLDFDSVTTDPSEGSAASKSSVDEDEDEKESVIRHLLEASDDELGLPASISTDQNGYEVVIDGGDSFGFCDGLWDLEDEAANY